MKVDVAKLAEDVARRKREQRGYEADMARQRLERASVQLETYRADAVEGRVLVALLVEPVVVAWCDELEGDDFANPPNRVVLAAVRSLQQESRRFGVPLYLSVAGVLAYCERLDAERDSHLAENLRTHVATLLGEHVWNTYGDPGTPERAWLEHDLRKLRELAQARRGA